MKSILVFLLTLVVANAAVAQYTVTKVNGHVINKTTGIPLAPGARLRDEDILEFSSANDMVRVIVSGKGVYVITPGPRKGDGESVIVEMLKSALKIKSKEGYLSGRSGEEEMIPQVLEVNAEANNRIVVTAMNKYLFDPAVFDVKNGGRFFLQTELPGAQPRIKPLLSIDDTLVIRAADFDTNITAIYKIGFFNKQKNSSQSLAEVIPAIDTTGEMEKIIGVIIANGGVADKEALFKITYEEVYEAIGKPPSILFREQFEQQYAGVKQAKK